MILERFVFVLCVDSLISSGSAAILWNIRTPSDNSVNNLNESRSVQSDLLLSTPELIKKYGYPVEEHTVQTQDGYLLTHFRIPHGRSESKTKLKSPIILQHGLLGASDLWILMGQEKSLGFILADAGYDVWLTNTRGNRHARRHVTLSPETSKFWNFSWHEMGYYDVPATIDYILATTGEKKVYYIGHSMGTTMLFVMTSTRPEYNDKLRVGIALAPVAFFTKSNHRLLNAAIPVSEQIADLLGRAGIWELFPYRKGFANLLGSLCRERAPTHELCLHLYNQAYGEDIQQLNRTLLPVFVAHLLQGTSTKNVHHYAQIIKSGKFHAFDYGPLRNMEIYGCASPPNYNLKNITAPISLHHGDGDLLVSSEGVQYLSNQLPRLVPSWRSLPPKFNHIDFILANDAKPLLFDELISIMKAY